MAAEQIFLWGFLVFLAGVGLASLAEISLFLFLFTAIAATFLFFGGLLSKKHKVAAAGILLASCVLGFWRFDMAWQHSQNNELTKINGVAVEISGKIVNDPVFNPSSQQIILRLNGLSEKILILARRYPEFHYGDVIEFSATLEPPQNFSDFDYKNYLAKDGIYSMVRYPEIKLISRGKDNLIYSGLLWIKHKLEDGINKSLPAPHNLLLVAILLGDQSGLSDEAKQTLNISGLRHLSAVSGTHITIMANIVAPFLIWLGFWRRKALWLTLIFIWSFVAMIGLPASAVRAGVMGSLMILAQIIGRPADTLRLIAIAAAFMVLQNPMVLRFDIGFQLSFLAVLGMVCFVQPIERKLAFIPPKPEFLRQALAITLAAQIFTLPVLIYNFGYVSLYAPIANVLVEPIVPFITIYGFVLAIAAAVSFVLGWILFFPMWLALSYLLWVANFFASLPGAALNFKINFFWLALSYAILGIIAWRIKQKEKLDFLAYEIK